jgi:hypothetical protein
MIFFDTTDLLLEISISILKKRISNKPRQEEQLFLLQDRFHNEIYDL